MSNSDYIDIVYFRPLDAKLMESDYPGFVISKNQDTQECEIRAFFLEGDLVSTCKLRSLGDALEMLGERIRELKVPYTIEELDKVPGDSEGELPEPPETEPDPVEEEPAPTPPPASNVPHAIAAHGGEPKLIWQRETIPFIGGSSGGPSGGANKDRMKPATSRDGKRCVREYVLAGPNDVTQYKPRERVIPKSASMVAMQVDAWWPGNFKFAPSAPKIPLGLFGGGDDAGTAASTGGKISFYDEPGMRLAGGFSLRAYIPGGVLRIWKEPSNKKGSIGDYSELSSITTPRDRWVTLTLFAKLNTPGEPNGVSELWIDDRLAITQTGLIYRMVDDWGFFGPACASMWGGPIEASGCKAPMKGELDYRDWRIWIIE